jgi:extradiol dioxygenase family protein
MGKVKKTFADLCSKDVVYYATINSHLYDKSQVMNISNSKKVIDLERLSISIPVCDKYICKVRDRWDDIHITFVNESDAIRYTKAQGIKRLRFLMDKAQNAINEVKGFRKDYHEELNMKWLDDHINELEKTELTWEK